MLDKDQAEAFHAQSIIDAAEFFADILAHTQHIAVTLYALQMYLKVFLEEQDEEEAKNMIPGKGEGPVTLTEWRKQCKMVKERADQLIAIRAKHMLLEAMQSVDALANYEGPMQ